MVEDVKTYGHETIVSAVASSVATRVQRLARSVGWDIGGLGLLSAKMLRTRLAARIAQGRTPLERWALVDLCAATELLHLASLCHDNVVATPHTRRRRKPVWLTCGASAAVLMGDLLLVEATEMVVATRGGVHVKSFLDKAKEVLESEVQQEVRGPDRRGDLGICHRLARGKAGPLFAFTAGLGGTGEPHLARALEEAGYQIGTAYQLANDLLDLTGEENTDARRVAEECVAGLCAGALEGLASWPHVQAGVAEFLVHDLRPSLARESSPRQATLQDAP